MKATRINQLILTKLKGVIFRKLLNRGKQGIKKRITELYNTCQNAFPLLLLHSSRETRAGWTALQILFLKNYRYLNLLFFLSNKCTLDHRLLRTE